MGVAAWDLTVGGMATDIVPGALDAAVPWFGQPGQIRLLGLPNGRNRRRNKLIVAAEYAGLQGAIAIPEDGAAGGPPLDWTVRDGMTDGYARRVNPMQRSPVAVMPQRIVAELGGRSGPPGDARDGACVFESNAILRLLARLGTARNPGLPPLLGASLLEAALVDEWTDFSLECLDPPARHPFGVWLGFTAPDDAVMRDSVAGVAVAVERLGERVQLQWRSAHPDGASFDPATLTPLVGRSVTVADIAVATSLDVALRYMPAEAWRAVVAAAPRAPFAVAHYLAMWRDPPFHAGLCRGGPECVDPAPNAFADQ